MLHLNHVCVPVACPIEHVESTSLQSHMDSGRTEGLNRLVHAFGRRYGENSRGRGRQCEPKWLCRCVDEFYDGIRKVVKRSSSLERIPASLAIGRQAGARPTRARDNGPLERSARQENARALQPSCPPTQLIHAAIWTTNVDSSRVRTGIVAEVHTSITCRRGAEVPHTRSLGHGLTGAHIDEARPWQTATVTR